jgi:hypothetical protein
MTTAQLGVPEARPIAPITFSGVGTTSRASTPTIAAPAASVFFDGVEQGGLPDPTRTVDQSRERGLVRDQGRLEDVALGAAPD